MWAKTADAWVQVAHSIGRGEGSFSATDRAELRRALLRLSRATRNAAAKLSPQAGPQPASCSRSQS